MNKEKVKEIIYIIIAILLGVLAVKFIIWLLPIILIGIVSYIVYSKIKLRKSSKNNTENKNNYKNENIKVIHDFDDED